ncbi:5-formyltetrahydrofolate cyclo-ligase [Candidatus Vallotia tarda]|uniref:5-formyltetrahydrofolate cyclo-ligase n=1 Tax=Candidatus Vallotiella hemipterorum TaxID=1177213 RepID=A0A916NUD5_9BURK|nr:5-formyltetrahydrofolate cyclo-ligase [Candidatus Vallotia tarda]CAG7595639.1 5-formyltetrahydrofolate cyclo-ligase [Candidatus Vallotia tarda]
MLKSIIHGSKLPSQENTTPSSEKKELRTRLLVKRMHFSRTPQRTWADIELAARLANILWWYSPCCVGLFWPVFAEFDVRAVVSRWLRGNATRRAALPVIVAQHAPMVYHAWTPSSPMKEGRHQIPVPAHEDSIVPDLLMVPCIGYDVSRYRLGYGGGYFDRTLAAWPNYAGSPVTVGIAYECLRISSLPHQAHDLPLDIIATDSICY